MICVPECAGRPMRQVVLRLQLVVAILVAMLAAGRGFPALVGALRGPTSHVCACASGGDHQSCPVCNPSLTEHRPSRTPAADRTPCGDPRVAVGAPGEVSTLPAPVVGIAPDVAWVRAPRPQSSEIDQVFAEPTTPPPRRSRT